MSFARPLAQVTFFRTWHNMALVYQFAFYINDKGVQVIIRTLLCIKEVIFTNDAKTRLYGGVSQWTYTTLFCPNTVLGKPLFKTAKIKPLFTGDFRF